MRISTLSLLLLAFLSDSAAIAVSSPPAGDWSVYVKSGDEALKLGNFAAAETNFRSALDAAPAKAAIPSIQVNYANSLMSQGKFKLATKETRKAMSLAKSISGVDSNDYGEALDLQAWMLQFDGKMQDAISSLKESIKVLESKSPDTSDLADAYEHMGRLDEMVSLFDQAKDNYAKALVIRQKLEGATSVSVADMQEKLAQIALRTGQPADAQGLYRSAFRIKEGRGEPWKPWAPEPTGRVVVFHFFPGAPNCQRGTSDGVLIERLTANGVTVEAGISQKPSDFAKTTRALVRVKNESPYDIDVLPQPPTFIQITPNVEILKPINAQELASKIEKKGQSKAKWIKFWGANATDTLYSYNQMSGPGMYGAVPGSFGWNGGGYGYGGGYGNSFYNSSYSGGRNWGSMSSMGWTQVPDYQKRAEAYQRAEQATTQSKADADSVRDAALGPNRLAAGGTSQGALDFEFSKYQSAILRIPIGNCLYEFHFD